MYLTLLTSASHFIVLVLSGKSCWGLLLGLMLVVCLRVLIVASSLPQALPALPSCAGCVSGGTWAARAYTQCPSCACPSHWRTSSFIGSSVTAFRLEKEEEQFVVYSKITIAKKKKIKGIIYCLLWLPNIGYVTVKIENTFAQAVNAIINTVPSQSIVTSSYTSLGSSSL